MLPINNGYNRIKPTYPKNVLKFLLIFFLLVPPLVFMPGSFKEQWIFTEYRESKLAVLLITFWLLAAWFSFFFFERYINQIKRLIRSSIFILLSFLSLYSMMSIYWACVPEAAIYETVQWVSFTFMFLIFVCLLKSKKWLKMAIYSINCAFIIVTLIGIIQTFKNIPFLMPISGTKYGSTFGSKNACFLSLGSQFFLLIFILGNFLNEKKKFYAILAGICIMLELIYVAISLSRTAYAALTIGMASLFIFMLLIVPKDKRIFIYKSTGFSLVIFFIVMLLTQQIYPRYWNMTIHRISNQMIPFILHPSNYLNKNPRGQLILDTCEMIKDHPFGVGAGNWLFLYPLYHNHLKKIGFNRKKQARKVHNDYIQYLAELGFPGFLAFIGLLFLSFKKLLSCIRHKTCNFYEKTFAACLTAQLVAVAIMLFFSFYLEFPYRKFLFVFLLSLIYTLPSHERAKIPPKPTS